MSRSWLSVGDDGRRRYLFHQSALSNFDLCLELGRLGWRKEIPSTVTDASALGTAVHVAAEAALNSLSQPKPLDEDGALEIASETFEAAMSAEGARWVKRTPTAAWRLLCETVLLFHREVLPRLAPQAVELYLGPHTLWGDDERVVQLAGTVDLVDAAMGLVDFKTGSAHSWKGRAWEKQRWSIQATVYTWLWAQATGHQGGPVPFTFLVLRDDGEVQQVQVVRRPEDWRWLAAKVAPLVEMIERGDDMAWPRNDTHALCSPKWCDAWERCKGAFVHDRWPH